MIAYHFRIIAAFVLSCFFYLPSNAQPAAKASSAIDQYFDRPGPSAAPGVLWMWMGSNISKEGITKDLEALRKAGFNRTTMFSLADVTTPWAGKIQKSPTPEIISWTEPWWKMVRHAALESKRLGMDFGMFNGPGYEASGGPWITPELSMQEICWSDTTTVGGKTISIKLDRPEVDPRANMLWPIYNPTTNLVEKPELEVRKTYYKDIVVLAVPATGTIDATKVVDISSYMDANGILNWNAPEGNWSIYRIGHTTIGALIQPAQWEATGLECDKMSTTAVRFHIGHIIKEIQTHIGDLIGTGFTHVHFDSYEAGTPSWTPLMREEFLKRRGYNIIPYLLNLTGRAVGTSEDSLRFRKDFDETIKDLYRDNYFKILKEELSKAKLEFLCEPYGGPWRQEDVLPLVDRVMTEFWTNKGEFSPYELSGTVAALRGSGQNIVEAEAFTGAPNDSKWTETPAWLKPIGDASFCAGVNRLVLHRFVHQPWDDRYQPGLTMGQWGTHFDRTQTWWKEMPALVDYWRRCQSMLQAGSIVLDSAAHLKVENNQSSLPIQFIERKVDKSRIFFVANTSHKTGTVTLHFENRGLQPECWDPVTKHKRTIKMVDYSEKGIRFDLKFEDAQSYFIVFEKPLVLLPVNRGVQAKPQVLTEVKGTWQLRFDSKWGGPKNLVQTNQLFDWSVSTNNDSIRYYSGTARYEIDCIVNTTALHASETVYLELGRVKELAHVFVNGVDIGTVWTAPWRIKVPLAVLKNGKNRIRIDVTNNWANRLIGDEQSPKDAEWLPGHMGGEFMKAFPDWFLKKQARPAMNRYCFTTWNYFTKDDALLSSGLMGPVRLIKN